MAGRHKGTPKTGGRRPGTPNKNTTAIKDAFKQAFDDMGGAEALVTWGRENQTDFYKLASKLIPVDMNAKLEGDLNINWPLPKTPLDE